MWANGSTIQTDTAHQQPQHTDRQTDRQTDTQTDTQTERETDLSVDRASLRYLPLKCTMTLKPGLGATQGHWKWHYSIDWVWLHIYFHDSIVTLALVGTMSEIHCDIAANSQLQLCTMLVEASCGVIYSVSQKKSPEGSWHFSFFHKRLRIFNQFFTHLLNVPIFARLQSVIQLSPILTKLCHIKRDYPVHIICSKCPKRAKTHA